MAQTHPKPTARIPDRAYQLDPTRAWDVVRASCGDAHTLPLASFDAAQLPPKRPGVVRFVCISDTHSYESKVMSIPTALNTIPDGDVLLHCGDFSNTGKPQEVAAFAQWFGKLPHARKILIAGNHDLTLHAESYEKTAPRFGHGQVADVAGTCAHVSSLIHAIPNCEYLCDSGTSVHGIKIWGSPWQPEFCEWAFNLPRGTPCRDKWRLVPEGTDVLLTHGPPLGHGDLCSSGHRAGCLDLLDEIQTRIRPRYHCFGHIHEGHGVTTDGVTTYINASTCNLAYRPINTAFVFDLDAVEPASSGESGLSASEQGTAAPLPDASPASTEAPTAAETQRQDPKPPVDLA